MAYEQFKTTERHPPDGSGCDGELDIKVDRQRNRVAVICKKCRKMSMVENGRVVLDGINSEVP